MNQPNSEDETFRRLKREPNFEVVRGEVTRRVNEILNLERTRILEEYGWTREEYFNQYSKQDDEEHQRKLASIQKKWWEFWK